MPNASRGTMTVKGLTERDLYLYTEVAGAYPRLRDI